MKVCSILKEAEKLKSSVRYKRSLPTTGGRPTYHSVDLRCLLSVACADRNIHDEDCVLNVATSRFLIGCDVPLTVFRIRVRGLSEQCLFRASIWRPMFSQG